MAAINPSNAGGPPDAGLNNSNIPLVGSLFANPVGENKTAEFYRNAATLNAYRPERQQGLMNTIGNRSTAYQGANNALASMYGSANAQPPSQLMSNPMSPNMLGLQNGAPTNQGGSAANNYGMAQQAAQAQAAEQHAAASRAASGGPGAVTYPNAPLAGPSPTNPTFPGMPVYQPSAGGPQVRR